MSDFSQDDEIRAMEERFTERYDRVEDREPDLEQLAKLEQDEVGDLFGQAALTELQQLWAASDGDEQLAQLQATSHGGREAAMRTHAALLNAGSATEQAAILKAHRADRPRDFGAVVTDAMADLILRQGFETPAKTMMFDLPFDGVLDDQTASDILMAQPHPRARRPVLADITQAQSGGMTSEEAEVLIHGGNRALADEAAQAQLDELRANAALGG